MEMETKSNRKEMLYICTPKFSYFIIYLFRIFSDIVKSDTVLYINVLLYSTYKYE